MMAKREVLVKKSKKPKSDDQTSEAKKRYDEARQEQLNDESIEESFPASDPPSPIVITEARKAKKAKDKERENKEELPTPKTPFERMAQKSKNKVSSEKRRRQKNSTPKISTPKKTGT